MVCLHDPAADGEASALLTAVGSSFRSATDNDLDLSQRAEFFAP
jgi:hypothetical protein